MSGECSRVGFHINLRGRRIWGGVLDITLKVAVAPTLTRPAALPWEQRVYLLNTLSIFRIILSAHCTAAATSDSERGVAFESNSSSAVLMCRATRIPATMARTRLRPSSISPSYCFRFSFASDGFLEIQPQAGFRFLGQFETTVRLAESKTLQLYYRGMHIDGSRDCCRCS